MRAWVVIAVRRAEINPPNEFIDRRVIKAETACEALEAARVERGWTATEFVSAEMVQDQAAD